MNWIKLKQVFQISVIATGTTQGSGKRAGTFGAIVMTLVGPDGPVSIGEVGTGFNDREIKEIKQRMESGELLVLEVEIAAMTKQGKVRFPSFKYIRTDVTPLDCTIDQLDAIPVI
jgi:bifunctional non-homologous end joining protein LigD